MAETNPENRTFHLRDYQQECLAAIMTGYRAGVRRQLTCLPTGSGKAV
jgi:superfamily II DNA or RNA helicase